MLVGSADSEAQWEQGRGTGEPERAAGASVTVCVARESLRATALNKICKYHSLFTYDRLPLPNGQLGSNAKSAAGRMPKATRLNQEDRCGVRAESIQDSG